MKGKMSNNGLQDEFAMTSLEAFPLENKHSVSSVKGHE